MKIGSLYRVELCRLLQAPVSWLLCGLSILAPLAGYRLFPLSLGDTMSALYLANPMLAGGLAGTVIFALLMLLTLDRSQRGEMSNLIGAVVGPLVMQTVQLLTVLTCAVLTALLTGLLYLPYTMIKLDIVFSMADYWRAVLLIFMSGPIMGALAAAVCYPVVRRLDVSLLAVLVAVIISRGPWCSRSFMAQWCVPLVSTLSDAFGSAIVWRTGLYSRLVWLCILSGGWLISLLCSRQYGKGLLGSFLCHLRYAPLPLAACLLLTGAAGLWRMQPFVDHSPENWSELTAQEPDRYNEALQIVSTQLEATVQSYFLGTLSGRASYTLRNTSGAPQDLYFDLNPGYRVRSVTANGVALAFEDLHNDFIASRELRCTLPAQQEIELVIVYDGMPRIWNAQEEQLSGSIISSQSLSLSSMHLAPTVAGCASIASEETPVTLQLDLPVSLVPVSTGSTKKLSDNPDGTCTWLFRNTGTDRIQLYAGDYTCAELSTGTGMPILFYYSQKYRPRLQNGAIDLMEQAILYCTEHYGPRTGFTQDEPFKIVQLTGFLFGGFANYNISGMGESYFSDNNLQDPEKGASSAEVLAHEIIHQWWGLGATLADPDDPDWSDEGITVYTTYRLMRKLMGQEYAQTHYVDQWQRAMQNQRDNFYLRNPEYLRLLPERYQNDIQASVNASNWYDGNALMIYTAAQRLGEDKMDAIWSQLYLEGGAELPPYITLGDFLSACGLQEGEISRG